MLPRQDDAPDHSHDEDHERDEDRHALSRPRPFRRARLAGKLAACAALIAGLSLVARDRAAAPEPPQAWREPPRAQEGARRAVAATEPLLTLRAEAAELAPRAEPTRWNAGLGQREDSVSQGAFDTIEAPYLLVTATDAGARTEAAPSLFVTLVRRAADGRGLSVTRTGERGVVATRLGSFETVEATLAGEGRRSCTGFRSLDLKAVSVDGWLCGILGQAPEPKAVACAIDRIALAGQVAANLGADMATGASACQPEAVAGTGPGDRTGSIAVAGAPPHNAAKSRRN
ncbi:hypothetical protein [Methylobacterium sp. B4]|uniref:hypothetical protein n=1 Tax=Methylobacterium sp. B4 TaxID=1938755 RepID=UPI000D76DA54|nr:hypothetical protein [Methylobacterium sp. B4]PXW67035.1 hypothetical protein BY998_101598 [Methylobacterium sp. B4]